MQPCSYATIHSMSAYFMLPLNFIRFWFLDAPRTMVFYFASVNKAFLHLVSLPLFLRTFFKPLKNEYRQGLVGFSIGMGIGVKSILIVVDLIIFTILLMIEFLIILGFIFIPLGTIKLLFL